MNTTSKQKNQASSIRIVEAGERDATVLEQDSVRVLIDDEGGMVPEFSSASGKGRINAHWQPWFRSNSGEAYKDAEHGAFWKSRLLYNIAGSFPCIPNFGPGHLIDGVTMPPHGWTADGRWHFDSNGVDDESGAAWAVSSLKSPGEAFPLSFKKTDMVVPGQPVHYASITVKNSGSKDLEICAGWHNTLGSPFLQAGCRLSGAASTWATPPLGGEFDTTSRLAPGAQFSTLGAAPLDRDKKTTDISEVPGPIGYTDFVTGVIPQSARIGWSALVNPNLKMAYFCFYTGPQAAASDDIILYFNEFWMQYGGRPFTPWAPYDGGSDLTYCLGTENAVSAYAYGLEYARETQKLLGAPTTVTIPAHGARTLRYGTLFAPYEGAALDGGVKSAEPEKGDIALVGLTGEARRFSADSEFTLLKKIAAQ